MITLSPRRWFGLFVAASCCLCGALAGFNALVDPFGLIDGPQLEGFNREKQAYLRHQRLGKVFAVKRQQPRSIVIGASMVNLGLDPQHPALPQPAYNMGMPVMSLYETYRFTQHVLATSPLEEVVIGVYPGMFWSSIPPHATFREELLAVDFQGRANRFSDLRRVELFVSLDVTLASLQTIYANATDASIGDLVYPDGRSDLRNVTKRIARIGGVRKLFETLNEREELTREDELWVEPATGRSSFELFAELVRFCRSKGLRVHVLLAPRHHALRPHAKDAATRARLIEALRAEPPGADLSLWDFDHPSQYTTEPLPPEGDAEAELKWFIDAVHFRVELGNLMLSRIHGAAEPADFGIRLR